MNIILAFILREFGKGFLMGIFIRSLFSFTFKTPMTPKGFFMSGIVVGIVYTIITFIIVMQI